METALRAIGVPLETAVELKAAIKGAKNKRELIAVAKDKKFMPTLSLIGVAYLYRT